MKVEEILSKTLEGLQVRFELSATYYPRDYCVQYRESDFAFASRLMEEEGVYYYFEHTADDVTLVITDTPTGLPDISEPNVVLFDGVSGGLRKDAHVNKWTKTQRLQSEKCVLWDHHFQLTGKHLEVEQNIQQSLTVGAAEHKLNLTESPLEVYDYPGEYAKRFDGVDPSGRDRSAQLANVFKDNQRTVQVRMEQQAVGCVRIAGESNHPLFASGHKFMLARHFNGDGGYLLTRVRHAAQLAEGYRTGEEAGDVSYENEFECLPAAAPFRPTRRTPKPVIAGFQTATVTGPDDSEIYVDQYGRVKAQFHWDRQGKFNADSSCWLRVAQVWAGPRWGGFFWPRVGHEVVVTFEDGDPDRPLIVGSVYNDKNMPPLELPGAAKQGGVKSCIFQSDPLTKFNALVFHDAKGAEYVQVHSQTHAMDNSESDRLEYAPQAQYTFQGSFL